MSIKMQNEIQELQDAFVALRDGAVNEGLLKRIASLEGRLSNAEARHTRLADVVRKLAKDDDA